MITASVGQWVGGFNETQFPHTVLKILFLQIS